MKQKQLPLCACGCGQPVLGRYNTVTGKMNRFLPHHSQRKGDPLQISDEEREQIVAEFKERGSTANARERVLNALTVIRCSPTLRRVVARQHNTGD